MNKVLKEYVLVSVFCALILLFGLIPQIGYITFIPGYAAITILHIIVLIGVMSLPNFLKLGKKERHYRYLIYPLILGFTFGLSSMLASLIYGATPFDWVFRNPLVSVLPRVIFGFLSGLIFGGFMLLNDKVKNKLSFNYIIIAVASFLILFGGAYALTYSNQVHLLIAVIVASLLWIGGLIGYYYLSRTIDLKYSYVPVAILFSTIVHTILVLVMFSLFGKSVYLDAFGEYSFKAVWTFIIGTLLTNSIIEALVAIIIGTPIIIAINRYVIKESQTLYTDYSDIEEKDDIDDIEDIEEIK
jgi:hypothetical protein